MSTMQSFPATSTMAAGQPFAPMGMPVPGMAQGLPGNMFAQHLPPMGQLGFGLPQSPSYVPPPTTGATMLGSTMGGFGFGGGMPYSPSYVPPVSMGAPYTVAPAAPVAAPVTAVAETSGSPIPETAPAPAATTVRYAAPAQTYSGFPQMGFGGYGGFQQFQPPPMPMMPPMPPMPVMPAFQGFISQPQLGGFGQPQFGGFGQPTYGQVTYGATTVKPAAAAAPADPQ